MPTFRWLGVNGAERELIKNEPRAVNISAAEKAVRNDVTESSEYMIEAAKDESLDVVQYITMHNDATLRTQVTVHSGAEVRLVQVFENKESIVSETSAKIEENAGFELVQLYLGGSDTISEIKSELVGHNANFTADVGYRLKGEDKLDINLIAEHFGRKSTSQITVNGVLDDTAEKVFKGTIDFKNGAKAAKGSEKESVLLLNEKVRNRTVPLILCAEEDVEGSHGASIGKLDEKHIFYMKSRGISEEKIYELAAKARLMQVISKIGDEQTKARVIGDLQWGDEDE